MRVSSWMKYLLALGLLSLLLGGACSRSAPLSVKFYYPVGKEGESVYNKIKLFSLAFRGTALVEEKDPADRINYFSPDSAPSSISLNCEGKEAKPSLEVEVIGRAQDDPNSQVVASGRTVIYHPCGKNREIAVFISPKDAFSTLAAYDRESGSADLARMIAGGGDETGARFGHQVVFLPDGRLFITGGATMYETGKYSKIFRSTLIFDPEVGEFKVGPTMSAPRVFHTATIVGDRIIVAGGIGENGGSLNTNSSIDVFQLDGDGKLERTNEVSMQKPRAFHRAIVTPNSNNILFYGGLNQAGNNRTMVDQWELFNPQEAQGIGKGTLAPDQQRALFSMNVVGGKVLVAGGVKVDGADSFEALSSVVVGTLSPNDSGMTLKLATSGLKEARAGHTANVLQNGQLFVVGGMNGKTNQLFAPTSFATTAEIVSPTGDSGASAPLPAEQIRTFHTSELLGNGSILVFGGLSSKKPATRAMLFPTKGSGIDLKPKMLTQRKDRFLHSATLLLNGSVLILGGIAQDSQKSPPKNLTTLYRGEVFNPGKTSTDQGGN